LLRSNFQTLILSRFSPSRVRPRQTHGDRFPKTQKSVAFPKKSSRISFLPPSAVRPASGPPLRARSVKPLIFVVVRSAARSQFPADTSGSKFVGDRSDTTSRTVNEGVQLLRAVGRWHPLLLLGGADCNMQRLQLDEESVALVVLPVREKRDNAMERIGRAGKSKN
jgi:hypothetical protein